MKSKQLLYASLAGNALEFYDLGLFGFLSPIIGEHFFPSDYQKVSIISALGVYAIGFLSCPLGAIIFGHIGDKHGRKIGLSLSFFLMSIPTLIIAFLHTYKTLGFMFTLLLVICRFLQGMCIGEEYNGSAIFLYVVFTLIAGYLADVYTPKRVMSLSMLLFVFVIPIIYQLFNTSIPIPMLLQNA